MCAVNQTDDILDTYSISDGIRQDLCDRMFINTTNKQNRAFPEVSGGSYCNRNVNSGVETYAANLIFMW